MSLDAIPSLCLYKPSLVKEILSRVRSAWSFFYLVCEASVVVSLPLCGIPFVHWCSVNSVVWAQFSAYLGVALAIDLEFLIGVFLTELPSFAREFLSLGLGFCLNHLLYS